MIAVQARLSLLQRTGSLFLIAGLLLFQTAPRSESAVVEAPTAHASATPGVYPHLTVTPSEHQFFEVKAGQPVRARFELRNVGQADLDILRVKPFCGCTQTDLTSKRIPPGDTSQLTLMLNTQGLSGHVEKIVEIFTNAPGQEAIQLRIKGSVVKSVEIQPPVFYFGNNLPVRGDPVRERILLHNLQKKPLRFKSVEVGMPRLRAQLNTLQADQDYELWVDVLPPLPSGTLKTQVTLVPEDPAEPALVIPVHGYVRPLIEVRPAVLRLPSGALPADLIKQIYILNHSTGVVEITRPQVQDSRIQLKLQQEKPAGYWRLDVSFPKGWAARPGAPLEITLSTSEPEVPVVRIPVVDGTGPGGFGGFDEMDEP